MAADNDDRKDRSEQKADQLARVNDFFDEKIETLAQVLRAEVTAEAFISVVKSAISRNQKILDCDPMTVWGAVYDAAKLGLDVDPRTGEFWLIPRKNRDRGGILECTGMIGYKGFITLGKRSGVVSHVETQVVYRDEVSRELVRIDLAKGEIKHDWSFTEEISRKDEEIVGAYCVAWLPGVDRPVIEPLTRDQIEKRRRVSAAATKPGRPWHDWYPEMCRKTTVRAMFGRGYFPLTAKLHEPRKITIETPHLSLADALERDDRWEEQRKALVDPTEVESVEVEDTGEPAPVSAGDVFEEEDR